MAITPIMIIPTDRVNGLMEIAGSGQLERRELAHKTTEGRDTQHGTTLQAVGSFRRMNFPMPRSLTSIAWCESGSAASQVLASDLLLRSWQTLNKTKAELVARNFEVRVGTETSEGSCGTDDRNIVAKADDRKMPANAGSRVDIDDPIGR